MYSENGVLVDFEEINKLVDTADVFTVGFATFPERLIVDTRSNEIETPMVQVVEPARSARDRLNWLNRRRPSLGLPGSLQLLRLAALAQLHGAVRRLGRIRSRVERGDPQVQVQCDLAIKQLLNLDHEATLAILRGEHALTLWPRDKHEDDED